MDKNSWLESLGVAGTCLGASTGEEWFASENAKELVSYSPADGSELGRVRCARREDYERAAAAAEAAFLKWREVPAPVRGEIVRQIGVRLREKKEALGRLVSLEMGKILQEGLGEVQEMIDVCDFAVGLSRQLYGLTFPSERPRHRLMEQWHPLGPIAVITAYNFPASVWSWNAMLAAVCGDTVIWKPSSKTPLCAVAIQKIACEVLAENGMPEGVFNLVIGSGRDVGEVMLEDARVRLVSFTGSTETGRHVGVAVARRFGRTILELGGNNASIVTEHADMKQAVPGIVFGAAGTAGQRCTTTRRVIVHESRYEELAQKLTSAYGRLKIGNPLEEGVHVGPVADANVVKDFLAAVEEAKAQGGELLCGGTALPELGECYVSPAIFRMSADAPLVREEKFCPILYVIPYNGGLGEAIRIHNGVPHGLSSSIYTTDFREAEQFLSCSGSDCGIANVNLGTNGAEIGGAFGGEKETGGGRECGSDAWKGYMRRQSSAINFSHEMPLAQGIKFEF